MKRILIAACLCLAATSAKADENWHGPGWYVLAYEYAVVIWSGPYGSKDACEAAKPAPDEFNYDCEYLDKNPG